MRHAFCWVAALASALLGLAPSAAQCEIQQLVAYPAFQTIPGGLPVGVCTLGDKVFLGSPGGTTTNGRVYGFSRSATGWSQTEVILPTDANSYSQFGRAVCADGVRLVVGAPKAVYPGGSGPQGAVYVFELTGGQWIQTAKLWGSLSDDTTSSYGATVAIRGDWLLVGDPTLGSGGASPKGHAYLYKQTGAGWIEQYSYFGGWGSKCGTSLALTDQDAFVGCPGNGASQGEVGRISLVGVTPTYQTPISAGPIGMTGMSFGYSIAASGDLLAIGAPFNQKLGAGIVTVLTKSLAGNYVSPIYLQSGNPSTSDHFGSTVVLFAQRLFVAQISDFATYAFQKTGSAWSQLGKLKSTDPSTSFSAAHLASNGDWCVTVSGAGPAFVFSLDPTLCNTLLLPTPVVASLQFTASGAFTQTLSLKAGAQAAALNYMVVGTMSGIVPGTQWGGLTIPLNVDAYTTFTLSTPNVPPLVMSLGTLDSAGTATPKIAVPAGLSPSVVGLTLHHVALILDVQSPGLLVRSSTPAALLFVP